MIKTLKADRDAYITNRFVDGVSRTASNTGAASSLDLMKLYGFTTSVSGAYVVENTELTRLLLHFDLSPLRQLVEAGKVDVSNPSFSCTLQLFDVYGGQPTPENFDVNVYPLSSSFDEGIGRDVVTYSDYDVCSWLTSSYASGSWSQEGCGLGGGSDQPYDYITGSLFAPSLLSSQHFATGEEDLVVDVTTVISATLAGLLPDAGFRVSFSQAQETDQNTYFVKRFAARTAYDSTKHPRLTVKFDDSIQDDSQPVYLDTPSTLFMYSTNRGHMQNVASGTTPVVGKACMDFKLQLPVSGGFYDLHFTGSQHYSGMNPQTGVYSASVLVSSGDSIINSALNSSGSVLKMRPIWGSLDGTVAYNSGSMVYVVPPTRGPTSDGSKPLVVTVMGLKEDHFYDEVVEVRVNLFDKSLPLSRFVKRPVSDPGITFRDTHYQVRDVESGKAVIPFDTAKNSTRLSSDSSGMFFRLDMTNLEPARAYVVDIMTFDGSTKKVYPSASPVFRVCAET